MIYKPAFEPAAPGPDINLDAVLLHVRAGGQEQPAALHCPRGPAAAPVVEPSPVALAFLTPEGARAASLSETLADWFWTPDQQAGGSTRPASTPPPPRPSPTRSGARRR
jgi:hypothetical protein